MSKIGKRPIQIKEGVEVKIVDNILHTTSGANEMTLTLPAEVSVEIDDNQVKVGRIDDSKSARSKHGLINRLIANMITGVSEGFDKVLTFLGTGYRVAVNGNNIVLNMGYSHEIVMPIPAGLEVKVVKNTITVHGMDKERVGQFAADIREVRPPEVYKGKGIKYKDELIRRKAGKTAASK